MLALSTNYTQIERVICLISYPAAINARDVVFWGVFFLG